MEDTPETPKWPGIEIRHLILDADEFIVWLDKELDVDWLTTKQYDDEGPKDSVLHNEMLNLAATHECIPNDHHETNIRLNFKRMIGEGVARSLDHDYESAKEILDQARTYVADRNIEKARFWQLRTACIFGIILLIAALILWTIRGLLTTSWGEP